MEENKIKYYSLDEAREEIKKRWSNLELKKQIEEELGDDFISSFKDSPKAISWKAVMSPDNSFTFFLSCSTYLNIEPLFFEYLGDKFTSVNEEKKNLGRLFLKENGVEKIFDICNIQENENCSVKDVVLRNKENMVSFYNSLFKYSGYNCNKIDITEWAHKLGTSDDYYYKYLLHFVCHGIAFEMFLDETVDKKESNFTNNVIIPKIQKIKEKYGIEPLIIKPYPSNQDKKEDFYWWSFQPLLNNYLLDVCKNNNFNLKK